MIIPASWTPEAVREQYGRLDGLLLPGGVDVAPEQYGEERLPELGRVDTALDRVELELARWALEDDLPVLAICRGIQVLNVAAGGSLYQDIQAQIAGRPGSPLAQGRAARDAQAPDRDTPGQPAELASSGPMR